MYPDLNAARDLACAGAAAVMPLAAPIGSNKGLTAKEFIQILIDEIELPIIVDAGIGRPSQACEAMEMGAAAVMANTALATAGDIPMMAAAFRQGIEAGRKAYLAGLGRAVSYTHLMKRIGILTGGGDCPGLNAVIRSAVIRCEQCGMESVGLMYGWRSMIDNRHVPLNRKLVKGIQTEGGTILGSSRTNLMQCEGGLVAAKRTLENLKLDAVIAIGGDDTLGVAMELSNRCLLYTSRCV